MKGSELQSVEEYSVLNDNLIMVHAAVELGKQVCSLLVHFKVSVQNLPVNTGIVAVIPPPVQECMMPTQLFMVWCLASMPRCCGLHIGNVLCQQLEPIQ